MAAEVRTGPPAFETGDAPPTPRIVAPGGWRRAVTAFLLGAAAGVLAALVVPRDEGPRRVVRAPYRPLPTPSTGPPRRRDGGP